MLSMIYTKDGKHCRLGIKEFTDEGVKDVVIIYDNNFEGRKKVAKVLFGKLETRDILFVNGLRMAKRDGIIKYIKSEWFEI